MREVNVAVIGSGSWATAIVKILLNNVEKVSWWVREKEIADHLQQYGHNPPLYELIVIQSTAP